ncbi:MAG: hypothetical protein IKJ78_08390 [Bacteroidales bacterium]|nr:hypothetical protein [Bacteroidales bacterium]
MGNKFREKQAAEEPKAKVEEPVVETVASEPVAAEEAKPRKKGRADKAARGLGRLLGGDLLADKLVLRQIPLLLLCLLYLLLIIGNRYRIESMSREKLATEERINYLREQRIQMQKQYQQSVKMSQIAEDLKETGVGITAGPPYEL